MAVNFAGLLVAACLAAFLIEYSQAVCCVTFDGFCQDCHKTSYQCGKGSCNIFGCACKGGCRESCGAVIERPRPFLVTCRCTPGQRSLPDSDSSSLPDSDADFDSGISASDYFNSLDTDRDGSLSKEEFMQGAEGSGGDANEEFDAMDENNDGKIDANEFDPDMK